MIRARYVLGVLFVCSAFLCPQQAMDLRIGPGDLLSIQVFDVPELKQEVRVNVLGDVQVAPIGAVHLGEMTVEQAQDTLAANLESGQYVPHPKVLISIAEYATQGVAVSGEVRKPGVYRVLGPRSLLHVLSEAGGPSETASRKAIVRHTSGEQVDADLTNTAASASLMLQPGDTVVVLKAGIAYIVGDVSRAGGYVMHDKSSLTLARWWRLVVDYSLPLKEKEPSWCASPLAEESPPR